MAIINLTPGKPFIGINDTIVHEGVELRCVAQDERCHCRNCYFQSMQDCLMFNCVARDRKDNTNVIFIKIKQGEL